MNKALKGFITYSHKDAAAKEELRERLVVMEQKDEITTWDDGEITPGDKWYEDISQNLAETDILLYLVSAASLASKNCNKELTEALENDITVIPIILEHCDWKHHPVETFEVLPLKGKPISKWDDPSEGWQNVVDGVRRAISKIRSETSASSGTSEKELLAKLALQHGNFLIMLKQTEAAINAYSQAIELNPHDAAAYYNRGVAYADKGDLDTALRDYSKAIDLDPKFAKAYNNRGNAYAQKGDLEAAIKDFNEAIDLDPDDAVAYNNRGIAYAQKGDLEAAIKDFNEAIDLDPKRAENYYNCGNAYAQKRNFDQALRNYSKAIDLKTEYAEAYKNRGMLQLHLRDWEKAKEDFTAAKDMGFDITAFFHEGYKNVEAFEAKHKVKLPEDIAALLQDAD